MRIVVLRTIMRVLSKAAIDTMRLVGSVSVCMSHVGNQPNLALSSFRVGFPSARNFEQCTLFSRAFMTAEIAILSEINFTAHLRNITIDCDKPYGSGQTFADTGHNDDRK